MADLVKVRYGLNANLPTTKDENTLYFVTDTKKIYRGDIEYTGNISDISITSSNLQSEEVLTITFKDGTTALSRSILSPTALATVISIINNTATGTQKGLVTLSDSTNDNTNGSSEGIAATPKAVHDALEAAKNYTDEAIEAGFAANDAMVFKGTIAADGTITSSDANITGKKISAITGYQAGWTFRATATSTNPLWSSAATTKVEAGDMIVAVKDYGTSNTASDWSIVQSNLIGAVTTDSSALTADQVVLGNGTQKVKILAAGTNGHVLTIVNGKPTWQALPAEQDTTYTFASGSNGSFTVTPLGGSAQTVSIGKPATAGTADTANVALKGKINNADTAFGAAAAKGVSTSIAANDNLITARPIHTWKSAVDTWQGGADDKFEELYDALTWKNFES
jgi:hypothetical protein